MAVATETPAPANASGPTAAAESAEERFDIWEYQVEGNTLLPTTDIERAVYDHLGEQHSIKDVKAAQTQLEDLYHQRGYGTVLVDIPEQDVVGGVIKLKVTEAKIGRSKVTGSRYFSLGRIAAKVPALAVGQVPSLPKVQEQLAALSQISRDRVITPVLRPSKTPGKLDVELKVKDTLPLHGSVELNDRYSADTTRLRLNASIRYDNLWQREHSLGFSYQTSPQDANEVEVFAANYLWRFEDSNNLLSAYAVKSNSNVATVGTLGVIGAGVISGLRYTIPLRNVSKVYHSVTLGADYKDFGENIGLQGNTAIVTPISYLMFTSNYSASYYGDSSTSHFDLTFNFGPDGLGNTQKEFERKRFKAIPNFAYLRLNADHVEQLWGGTTLFGRVGAQVADSPLISNEEFAAGGVDSVRGYLESERQSDNALAAAIEFRSPNFGPMLWPALHGLQILAFTDAAELEIKDPLPGTKPNKLLWSTGLGLHVDAADHLQAMLTWAYPLKTGDRTTAGDQRVHFSVGYDF
ncbi:MAG: ShlB/FhaC/HecB family hemolysin secretion/activation protein [Gammaproteobacteria bacterium]|nr:ShlB/FhaC/HecB family hemolysin secretion/activation protein [Gammaproteobacteria bacterium]